MARFCLAAASLFALGVICERTLYLLRAPVPAVPLQAESSDGELPVSSAEAERLRGPGGRLVRAALAASSTGRDAVAQAVHVALLEQSPLEWARLEWLWLCAQLGLVLGVIFVLPAVGAHLSAASAHGAKTALDVLPLMWGAGLALVCVAAHGVLRSRAKARLARLDRFALELLARWPERAKASAPSPSAERSNG